MMRLRPALAATLLLTAIPLLAQVEPVQFDVVDSFTVADYGYSPSFRLASRLNIGGFGSESASGIAFDASLNRLYVLDSATDSLRLYDLHDPSEPVEAGMISRPEVAAVPLAVVARDGTVVVAGALGDTGGFLSFRNGSDDSAEWVDVELPGPAVAVDLTSTRRIALLVSGSQGSELYLGRLDDPATAGFAALHRVPVAEGPGAGGGALAFSESGRRLYAVDPARNVAVTVDPLDGRILARTELPLKSFADTLRPSGTGAAPDRPVGLDPSDRDGIIGIVPSPVLALLEPADLGVVTVGDRDYLVTANTGLAVDRIRVSEARLDPDTAAALGPAVSDTRLGRLYVSPSAGDTDGDGDLDRLVAHGGRSFSVWSEGWDLLFDSGDLLEQILAAVDPFHFNAGPRGIDFDEQSPGPGPEPSAIGLRWMGNGRLLVAVALRGHGSLQFFRYRVDTGDIAYLGHRSGRNFDVSFTFEGVYRDPAAAGDLAPSEIVMIPSGPGRPNLLMVVANSLSGTVSIWEEYSPYYSD